MAGARKRGAHAGSISNDRMHGQQLLHAGAVQLRSELSHFQSNYKSPVATEDIYDSL